MTRFEQGEPKRKQCVSRAPITNIAPHTAVGTNPIKPCLPSDIVLLHRTYILLPLNSSRIASRLPRCACSTGNGRDSTRRTPRHFAGTTLLFYLKLKWNPGALSFDFVPISHVRTKSIDFVLKLRDFSPESGLPLATILWE